MASSKVEAKDGEWISVQFDANTGKLFVKKGTPKQPEVETMPNGIKRVRLVLGLPIREGFVLCNSCMGWAYQADYVLQFNGPHGTYGVCKPCWPKVATCKFCQEVVSPEQYKPGLDVRMYCPGCSPTQKKPLEIKQAENLIAEVNILKARRDKRWESSSSEQTQSA